MLNLQIQRNCKAIVLALLGMMFSFVPGKARAQAFSGTIQGTVVDPSSAIVPGAEVQIENPVSGYTRQAKTDVNGSFSFVNIPYNPYHLTVTAQGFTSYTEDVDVKSSVPIGLKITLKLGGSTTSVTVTANASDLLEVTPEEHTDVDRTLIENLPLESQSSSVSSLITLSSPGVSADSNGLFHGLGDHAENSFSVDGQPITDQQSKVFSNQIPMDSIQSLEVIEGAPPPEYGGKTSLVIKATTRSGLDVTKPTGEINTSYGSFGTATTNFNVAFGGPQWGEFLSVSGMNTGRFLDGPEFQVMHDKGNEESIFDRFDVKLSDKDTVQLNFGYTRSWFQTPNSYDSQLHQCTVPDSELCNGAGTFIVNPLTGNPLGPTDQRSQIGTINVAPSWTHLINTNTVLSAGVFVRRDQYDYYPSNDPFNDFIAGGLQSETIGQNRTLTNVGGRTDLSYVKGAHNIKVGVTFQHTFLTEADSLGIIDPTLLSGLGCPDPTIPQCATLAPFDLTAGGSSYLFTGHTDIKETALYAQDSFTKGPWAINYGLRVDFYDGLNAKSSQVEPRGGIAYNIKKTGTVLRASYARTMESPFNENLIISSTGCSNPVVNAIMTVSQGFDCVTAPLTPGFRNEFHAGLQQAFGKYFVLSGEYIWKYTHNAYDFNVLGFSPITFPIEWRASNIPGFAIKGNVPDFHGLTAFIVVSSVAARFYPPTVSGIAPIPATSVFRIDHDEILNQTTHVQYQPFKRGPWFGFSWRYDSGLVAGSVPDYATALSLDGDQQAQMGLFCGSKFATVTAPLTSCSSPNFGALYVVIPGTPANPAPENDDHNPPRIASRNLFDLAIGDDDLFHNNDRYKWSARFTVINVANTEALYNFLSTFSGTHYVTPRTLTGEIGFHF